jgi:peptidyl-prolyl cis-trans isomerase D
MLSFLRAGNKHTKVIWWILIIVTVVTFVGGFVFLFGAGLDTSARARATGAVGSVDGRTISHEEWLGTLNDQRAQFRQRFGADPVDRDEKGVETQAWRSIVARRLFEAEARREGIKVTPREVVLAMQTSPPSIVTTQPAFQTNGQFDPQKYAAALRDPNNNWSGVEQIVRDQLPVRKLQERLLASIKLSEPELKEAFHDRFDRATATVLMVPASRDTGLPPPTEADLQRVYEKYKSRFMTSARTQLEMLIVPKSIGEPEVKLAQETAQDLVRRARAGEDFASLVRDYSDLKGGQEGGVIDRIFQPGEFGPELGPKIAAMKIGDVADPLRDGTRFIVFRLVDRPAPANGQPGGLKVAQLVIKIRPDDETMRQQYKDLDALRKRAKTAGLGPAAAEKGLATSLSEFYNANNTPNTLLDVPEAGDWGLGAKQGEVSPVFEGVDDFALVQVKAQQAAGFVPRERIAETVRQIADMDARVERAKPAADAIEKSLAAGQPLEKAAQVAGLSASKIEGLTRRQPDPRVAGAPDLVGMLFAAEPGKALGPVRGLNGWYFGRLESVAIADTALYAQSKGQISNEILQNRQQTFFGEFVAALRAKAKIADLRTGSN